MSIASMDENGTQTTRGTSSLHRRATEMSRGPICLCMSTILQALMCQNVLLLLLLLLPLEPK